MDQSTIGVDLLFLFVFTERAFGDEVGLFEWVVRLALGLYLVSPSFSSTKKPV